MFNPEIAQTIVDRISHGESLRSVCRDAGMPAVPTFLLWVNERPELAEQYARAQENRADVYFDRLDDVSETAASAESAVTVAGLRLKADNIKWQLARMSPKKYGDKVQLDHSGGIAVSVDDMSDAALAKIAAGAVKPDHGEG